MRRILSGNWRIYLLYLFLTGLWLSPMVMNIRQVPFQPGAAYSDLLISHLANSEFIHRALMTWRAIPLWNPTILSGLPLAADPLSGLWYPPNWIPHLWPTPMSYNLLTWAHLAWLGFGMYTLARSEGLGNISAVLCGGLAAGMPKLIGHIGLGHVGLVFATSWTPWLLRTIRAASSDQTYHDHRVLRWALTAGGILGLIVLIDPRWAPFAGVLGLAYALRLWRPWEAGARRQWRSIASSGLLGLITAVAVACGLSLPLIEFTQLSTRMGLSSAERSVFSLSRVQVIGLFLPDPGGYAEGLLFFGAAALLLAAIGLVARTRHVLFWEIIAVAALLFAFGENAPLYGWVSDSIPGMDLLRVPTRSIFLLGFSVAIVAAHGFDVWLRSDWRERAMRRVRLTTAGLAMFILLLSLGGVVLTNSPPSWIYPILAAIAAGLLLMGVRPAGPSRWVWIGFLAAATLELAWMGNSLVEMRPFPPDAYAQIDLPETCVGGEAVRLLSPSYSVPQLLAAREGLELADGVNPLHLETYRAYMAMAMGFPADTYSVTLPPFAEGDPEADWHPALSMPALARLNITCIVSAYPLQADGLSLLKTEAGQHYYRLSTPGPRAWVETGGVVEEAEVDLMHWSPNHIELRAQGPGRLILSEVAYPGWQARIDGAQVPIGSAFNLLRSVELPEGVHSIDFRFRPWSVYLGAAISLTGALLILWAWIRK